jgi:hypothetical protein
MFIIYLKNSHEILSYGYGTPTESNNKLYLNNEIICNDLNACAWKHITDQPIEQDEFNIFIYKSDYYDEVSPPQSIEELEQRIQYLEQQLSQLGG